MVWGLRWCAQRPEASEEESPPEVTAPLSFGGLCSTPGGIRGRITLEDCPRQLGWSGAQRPEASEEESHATGDTITDTLGSAQRPEASEEESLGYSDVARCLEMCSTPGGIRGRITGRFDKPGGLVEVLNARRQSEGRITTGRFWLPSFHEVVLKARRHQRKNHGVPGGELLGHLGVLNARRHQRKNHSSRPWLPPSATTCAQRPEA